MPSHQDRVRRSERGPCMIVKLANGNKPCVLYQGHDGECQVVYESGDGLTSLHGIPAGLPDGCLDTIGPWRGIPRT